MMITVHNRSFREEETAIAARREVSQRKTRLLHDLRASYRSGEIVPGEIAPSVRDLAHKYELSVGVVVQQMQVLVQEGLFYTVAGSGTFVGQKALDKPEFYLFVLAGARNERELKNGFEEEIARRGGTTLVMVPEQIRESVRRQSLPPVAGLYLFRGFDVDTVRTALTSIGQNSLPEVNFDNMRQKSGDADLVNFDDADGGRQAAQHLVRNGHSEIAFLGIHAEQDAHDCSWSVRRMEGWQSTIERERVASEALIFLPERVATRARPDSASLLRNAAKQLLRQSNATAVVAASDDAALQLVKACRELSLPSTRWPAIVSFDGTLPLENNVLTSLRLPWEELGRLSAKTLWERAHHQLGASTIHRMAPLRMIPRLTCQANWSLVENLQATF